MGRKPTGKPTGVPPIPVDWEKVDRLIECGCNGVQVAAKFGIHPDTLYDRCQEDKGMPFSHYYKIKRASGDATISEAQYEKAVIEKNTTMLIWLGKQRLGQKETISEMNVSEEKVQQYLSLMQQLEKLQSSALNISESNINKEQKS